MFKENVKNMAAGMWWAFVAIAGLFFASVQVIELLEVFSEPVSAASFKDKAEIESEFCLKGKHVVVFTALKHFDENIQLYVEQAGYKETFAVVLGNCKE